jgi:hypothetical protein
MPLALIILSACATMPGMQNPSPMLEADRPDFSESTETVPPGSIQAEAGYTFSHEQGNMTHSIGELVVRVPTGSHAEIQLALNSYLIEHVNGLVRRGFEDMEIGTKIRLIEREERSLFPNVSILAFSTLPTGNRDIGSSVIQPTGKLALSWQLNETLSLESNANYSYASEDGTRFSQWATSASLGAQITPRLESFVEWYGINPISLGIKRADYLDVGAALGFGSSLRLDTWAGVNTRNSTRDYFVGLGVSRRW